MYIYIYIYTFEAKLSFYIFIMLTYGDLGVERPQGSAIGIGRAPRCVPGTGSLLRPIYLWPREGKGWATAADDRRQQD